MEVSIITVCYNSEKTIERTIKSVLNQTYQDYEYIEACQINGANISDIVSLIQTKTGLLQSISHIPECSYIAYPVSYTFKDYQISIHNPGDYLIWREDLQRFLVLNESIFLTLYKRV